MIAMLIAASVSGAFVGLLVARIVPEERAALIGALRSPSPPRPVSLAELRGAAR